MDPKVVLSAVVLTFLAELGDKTQLAALFLTAETKKPWSVFLGASLSLVFLTFIATAVGAGIAHLIPREVIVKVAGAVFVVVGVLVFIGKL